MKGWRRPNGLFIEKVRVPIGVILMIYESRPNVTADAAATVPQERQRLHPARRQRGASTPTWRSRGCCGRPSKAAGLPADGDPGGRDHGPRARGRACQAQRPRGPRDPPRRQEPHRAHRRESKIPVIKHYEGHLPHVRGRVGRPRDGLRTCASTPRSSGRRSATRWRRCWSTKRVAAAFLPAMCRRFEAAGVELRGDEASRGHMPTMKDGVRRGLVY